jgi:hypothetical protein
MKKHFIALLTGVLVFSAASFAQTQPQPQPEKKSDLWLNETTHDFGKIPQGKPVFTFFELKNVADSLKLEMVQAGCGCTTPEFKAGTYAPGETVKIKIGYNAAAGGQFSKPVTITYNGGQQKVIMITGTVETTPSAPAPGNGAVGKIKP